MTGRGPTACRSRRRRPTRWCCGRRPTAGSTSTARASSRREAATCRGRRPTRARFVLDAGRQRPAARRRAGTQTDPREPRPRSAANASARRLEHGGRASVHARRPSSRPRPARRPGAVRLAVGGHPACLDRCPGGGGQGLTPDVHLQRGARPREDDGRRRRRPRGAAHRRRARLARRRAAGPGGRPPLPRAHEGAGVPTYVLPGPGDLPGGGDEAFARAFAAAPAPQGTGAAPDGVDVGRVTQPEGAGAGARSSSRSTCAPRRAPSASSPSTTPRAASPAGRTDRRRSGCARSWSSARRAASRSSWSAARRWTARSGCRAPTTPSEELALLAGHASAYVATAGVDDPARPALRRRAEPERGLAPGAAAPLTLFQSSTLGYAPARSPWQIEDDYDEAEFTRQTSAALLMIDVAVGRFDPTTGVAPVTAMSEPLLEALALDSLARTIPLGWALPLGVTAADPAPLRFLLRDEDSEPSEPLEPAQRLQRGPPAAGPMRAVVVVLRQRRPDRHRVHLVEPADRALRRGPARRTGERIQARPEIVLDAARARRRRPARLLLPARARNHGGDA